MTWLTTLLIVVQVLSAIAIIVLVLLQHGKGADMGAAFGGGASGSLFGATGSANFLSRSTAAVATVFFVATLALAYVGTAVKRPADAGGVMGTMPAPANTAPRDIPMPATPQGASPASAPAPATTPAPAGSSAPTTAPKPADIPK
jgi:preprotein translocase subunit SecG